MNESTTNPITGHFSPCASLAALGVKLRQLDLFGPIRDTVQIAQKTVKYTPSDKLYDGFIAILAGAHGLVEINTRLRSDVALQQAFGRSACAEQSVVQDTLDASTAENVVQLRQALEAIYRRHSQGYRHDYTTAWQILDADMSGMPCGRKAAFATRGYFAKQRNRRGRQLGRVLATRYAELVVDQLFPGTTQLAAALQELIVAAEHTLELSEAQRAHTVVRIDAGGGSLDDLNWLLQRHYQVHGKEYSGKRARRLAESVRKWVDDPHVAGRQVGWVTVPPTEYVRPVRRIAVRCRKKNGQWGVGVLISSLAPLDVLRLTDQSPERVSDPDAVLLAYVYFYDQRGGGIETANKEDKQGLGLTKRNKKRFAAQEIAVLLGTLAHNVLVWARHWLRATPSAVPHLGITRMVRDLWHISGWVACDRHGQVQQIMLNQASQLAHRFITAFQSLLATTHVVVNLGET